MEKFLPMINRNECCKIWLDDILYFEKNGRLVKIVTSEASHYDYGSISDYEQYFADDERFFACMKGLVINFDHVDSMKDRTIRFSNGREYDLGRTNYLKTKQTFVNYMLKSAKKRSSE